MSNVRFQPDFPDCITLYKTLIAALYQTKYNITQIIFISNSNKTKKNQNNLPTPLCLEVIPLCLEVIQTYSQILKYYCLILYINQPYTHLPPSIYSFYIPKMTFQYLGTFSLFTHFLFKGNFIYINPSLTKVFL